MREARPTRIPAQTLFGGLLFTIGVLLFLQNIGWLDGNVWQFWPLVFVVIGTLKLVAATGPFDRLLGLGLLTFGSLRIAATAFGLPVTALDTLAGLLVVFGALIAWRGIRGPSEQGRTSAVEAADTISALAFMGGYAPRSISQHFRGGDLTAFMGGIELDLRGSDMQEPAILDVFVMWGGAEIRVPDDWTVELRGMPILAGFEDKTRSQSGPAHKRLIVRGAVIMGGIEVKN